MAGLGWASAHFPSPVLRPHTFIFLLGWVGLGLGILPVALAVDGLKRSKQASLQHGAGLACQPGELSKKTPSVAEVVLDGGDQLPNLSLTPWAFLGEACDGDFGKYCSSAEKRATGREEGVLNQYAARPDSQTAIVDPAGYHHIGPADAEPDESEPRFWKRVKPMGPQKSDGASGDLYNWLGINKHKKYPFKGLKHGEARTYVYEVKGEGPEKGISAIVIHACGSHLKHPEKAEKKILLERFKEYVKKHADDAKKKAQFLEEWGAAGHEDEVAVIRKLGDGMALDANKPPDELLKIAEAKDKKADHEKRKKENMDKLTEVYTSILYGVASLHERIKTVRLSPIAAGIFAHGAPVETYTGPAFTNAYKDLPRFVKEFIRNKQAHGLKLEFGFYVPADITKNKQAFIDGGYVEAALATQKG